MSAHRITESDSETRALDLLAYYGIAAERGLYVPRSDELTCVKCGAEVSDPAIPPFLRAEEFSHRIGSAPCAVCGCARFDLPWFVVDLTFSRKRRIIGEVKGAKSSASDPKKMGWLRAHGYMVVVIRNEMVASPEDFKALCQALALSVGTSKPERLYEVEIG